MRKKLIISILGLFFFSNNILVKANNSFICVSNIILVDTENESNTVIEEEKQEEPDKISICDKDDLLSRILCRLWRFIWGIIRIIFYII